MRGFSLIEIIISLGLILITLTIFGVAVNTLPLTKNTRNQNLAYHLAAKKIEELRNTSFAALPASGAFSDPGFANLQGAGGSLTIADYAGSMQIKQTTVIVNWLEGGTAKSVTLVTLISNGGLNRP